MAPGSEPASGSDWAKAVVFSPRRTGKRYFSFCAGLSVNNTGRTSGPNTPGPRGGSATVRAISSQTTTIPNSPRPWPPYSVGTSSSQRPRSFALRSRSARTSGRIPGPSIAFISTGINSRSTKVLTVFLSSFSSSGSSKSMSLFPLRFVPYGVEYGPCCHAGRQENASRGEHGLGCNRRPARGTLARLGAGCAEGRGRRQGNLGSIDLGARAERRHLQKHGIALDIFYTQGAGETLQAVISGSADLR